MIRATYQVAAWVGLLWDYRCAVDLSMLVGDWEDQNDVEE